MIAPPERSPARDAAITAMLPLVPRLGWTRAALRESGSDAADILFPGGRLRHGGGLYRPRRPPHGRAGGDRPQCASPPVCARC